jgi:micrococcal nuclease
VKGKIVSTQNTGEIIFLNFGPNTGKDFMVLIFSYTFDKFPDNPQDFYNGKHVLVTGKIQKYKDAHSMIIPDPSRIEIVKEDTKKEHQGKR